MIKIIVFYYRDNSKFPDTIVHYAKHAGVIVYRAIFITENMYNTLVIIYRDNYHYRDNFAVHYRDKVFPLSHSPSRYNSSVN